MSTTLFKVWIGFIVLLAFVLAFEAGLYFSKGIYTQRMSDLSLSQSASLQTLNNQLSNERSNASRLAQEINNLTNSKNELNNKVSDLEGKVAGMTNNQDYPFVIPSEGTLGNYAGSFGGVIYGERHWAIDIWTTTENGGQIKSHKGNPVYAACDGKVVRTMPENGAVIILCDEIPASFKVPHHKNVYTYYGHMGNRETKELFSLVKNQQRVKKGQHIGYQGDLSSFYPEMRNVHLHFSVFTGKSENDIKGGALNPCLYIGGNCSQVGSEFKRGN